jgi:hypothetical protein
MKPIAPRLFSVKPAKGPASERGELLQFFLDNLNPARKADGYRPLTPAALGVRLSHLSLQNLYYLKSVCLDAERNGKPFSAIFWWSITPKENQ